MTLPARVPLFSTAPVRAPDAPVREVAWDVREGRLPVPSGPRTAGDPAGPETLPPAAHHRILIVDDNAAIHDDFRKIFAPPDAASAALDDFEATLLDARSPAADAVAPFGSPRSCGR